MDITSVSTNTMALFFLCFLLQFLLVKSQTRATPALYVFGDSLYDPGNNNYLQTQAKANYTPYGVDFPAAVPGRFTNGKTFVDFTAQSLELPLVRPYLSLSTREKINITTGVNYASGAAGILPESGKALGDNLSFDKQITYFRDTLLLKFVKAPSQLLQLRKSIFLVSIGNNDYINNYLKPATYPSSQLYTPDQFAVLLLNGLTKGLKDLYILGARKFVVFNIGRLGCVPGTVNSTTPRPTTPCVESVNDIVLAYNNKFPGVITQLERSLTASIFVRGDAYGLNQTSAEAGITAQQTPCCQVRGDGQCVPNSTPCPDRNVVLFYDNFHTTEIVNSGQATACFNGSVSCVPLNIQQLAQKQ